MDMPPRYLLPRLHSRHTKNFPLGKGTVFNLQEGSSFLKVTLTDVDIFSIAIPLLTNTLPSGIKDGIVKQ